MQDFETQVQGLIEPYTNKITALETENNQLQTTLDETTAQLNKFNDLMPLLEVKEIFKVEIKDASLIQRARIICDKLYTNQTRGWVDWKNGKGGKRPKDPVRIFIVDILNLVTLKPHLIYNELLNQPKYLEVEDD